MLKQVNAACKKSVYRSGGKTHLCQDTDVFTVQLPVLLKKFQLCPLILVS